MAVKYDTDGDDLRLQPHERNWFLQVSSGAGAQAVVNGVFGVRPLQNGNIQFQPSYNASMMSGDASLGNYGFRGSVYTVSFDCLAPASFCGFSVSRDGGGGHTSSERVRFGGVVECVGAAGGKCKVTTLKMNDITGRKEAN